MFFWKSEDGMGEKFSSVSQNQWKFWRFRIKHSLGSCSSGTNIFLMGLFHQAFDLKWSIYYFILPHMPKQTADKTMTAIGKGRRTTREKDVCYWIRLNSQMKIITSIWTLYEFKPKYNWNFINISMSFNNEKHTW